MKNWQKNFFKTALTFFMSLTTIAFATTQAYSPVFERDSNGNGVAAWLEIISSETAVRASTYVTGTWGAPATHTTGGSVTQDPVIGVNAIDSDETSAVVVWADDSGEGNTGLFAAMLPTSSGSWDATIALIPLATGQSTEDYSVNSDYAISVSSDGTAVVTYSAYNVNTGDQQIYASTSTIDSNNTWTTTIISD